MVFLGLCYIGEQSVDSVLSVKVYEESKKEESNARITATMWELPDERVLPHRYWLHSVDMNSPLPILSLWISLRLSV